MSVGRAMARGPKKARVIERIENFMVNGVRGQESSSEEVRN
jgi:hypothetical protein